MVAGGGGGGWEGGVSVSAAVLSVTLSLGGCWLSLMLRLGGGWLVSFHLAMVKDSSSSVSSYQGLPALATSSRDFSEITWGEK